MPKLRELILELAVRGKLVEQDESDEPARELIPRSADARTRFIEDIRCEHRAGLPVCDFFDGQLCTGNCHHFEFAPLSVSMNSDPSNGHEIEISFRGSVLWSKNHSLSGLSAAWQRVCGHFEVLYDTLETLPDLRQTILQLAVQGKLVPPVPERRTGGSDPHANRRRAITTVQSEGDSNAEAFAVTRRV